MTHSKFFESELTNNEKDTRNPNLKCDKGSNLGKDSAF